MQTTTTVLIRGRIERSEFREPFEQCRTMFSQMGANCRVNLVCTEPLDFALFFQSYPHEFLAADFTQLRRNNPFAPFLFVLGACCEGMLRTVGTLDSPFSCYAHAWSSWETEEIRRFLSDQPSIFSLPLTAENDEIALWQNPISLHPNPPPNGEGTLVNHSSLWRNSANPPEKCLILTQFGHFGNDSAMNQFLADELKRCGYAPVFSEKSLPAAFSGRIFADADNAPLEKILESIQRLRRQFADNDFTVYVDSPRIDEKTNYIRAGATRILPKMRYLTPYGTE